MHPTAACWLVLPYPWPIRGDVCPNNRRRLRGGHLGNGRILHPQPVRCHPAATANGILLQFSRLAMHHDDRRRVRLHLDGGRELRQLRAAAAAGNRRVLRGGWHLLRDDAGRLLRNVVERRELRPEHLRPTSHRLVLRRRRLLLGDDSGRLLRHVEQWRQLHAEYLRPAHRLVLCR